LALPSTQADSNPALAERRRTWPWQRVSLLWRVFAANVVVFVVAVVLLAWTPVTVHRVATSGELVVLVLGLMLMLIFDLVLLHRTFAPLRRLTAVMREVDPGQPGRRAILESSGGEVAELARALNAMLDRLEGERRESGRRALAAQEGERRRVARELHDEVGQVLTAIALRAERASQDRTSQPEALSEIAHSLAQSLEDVQRIGRELRPEALDDLGLINALIALCSRIDREAGLRIQRDLDWNLPPLSADEELVIYRIAQEALTNALRHAKANEVTVTLKHVDSVVALTVRDDGCGLPESRTESGLVGMRERALLIGAQLEIRSTRDAGTQITLTVPAARP
jgi:two-component system, NarL family, sensor histidine kinase UhpB